MMRRRLAAALGAALLVAGCSDKPSLIRGQPKELSFSILTTRDPASTPAAWEPLLEDLSDAAGIDVQAHSASDGAAAVEALRHGQAQAGWYPARFALAAVERAPGEVVARAAGLDGDVNHRAVLIARKGRKITLDGVLKCGRKLSFGLGAPESATGALAPTTYLFVPGGVDPAKCFKSVRAANLQANLQAVANGELDVATSSSVNFQFTERENPALADRLEIIWSSPPLPSSSIVVRKDLDPALKEKIRQFFITYGTGAGPEADRQRAILRRLAYQGFRPADDAYLDPIREILAGQALAEARKGGDKAQVAAAEANFDKVRAAAAQRRAADPDI